MLKFSIVGKNDGEVYATVKGQSIVSAKKRCTDLGLDMQKDYYLLPTNYDYQHIVNYDDLVT